MVVNGDGLYVFGFHRPALCRPREIIDYYDAVFSNFPGRYGFVEFAQYARNANPKQIHFFDDNHSPYENGVFSFAKTNFALLRKNPREEMETAYFYAISTQKLDKTTITHIPRAYFNSVI